jgi:hypothetical protein
MVKPGKCDIPKLFVITGGQIGESQSENDLTHIEKTTL